MSKTISIRASDELREALDQRALAKGVSVSDLARELLAEALDQRPLSARVGGLRGALKLSCSERESWREDLRSQNWR